MPEPFIRDGAIVGELGIKVNKLTDTQIRDMNAVLQKSVQGKQLSSADLRVILESRAASGATAEPLQSQVARSIAELKDLLK